MSPLDRLPDFGAPLDVQAFAAGRAYASFGDPDLALAWPDALAVSTAAGGRPDFRLLLERPAVPDAADPGHGALQFRIEQHCPIETVLAGWRAVRPAGTVAAAQPGRGFARLVTAGAAVALPTDLLAPMPLDWTGVGQARFSLPDLSLSTATLLKGALLASTLLVTAAIEMDVPGVSPRLALTASLAPRAVLSALLPPAPARRVIGWEALVSALAGRHAALGIVFGGGALPDETPDRRLGEVLADRLRDAFGRPVASEDGAGPTLEFAADAELPDAVQWDLSRPLVASRPWALTLDPLTVPAAWAAAGHLDDLVETATAAQLPFGQRHVSAFADLPARRDGVLAIGAVVRFPARPPQRLQDVVATIDFQAPSDRASLAVTLAPGEALDWRVAPFLVAACAGGDVRRIDGAEETHDGPLLELGSDDFPATFVPVSASADLLRVASLAGSLAYHRTDGSDARVDFSLGGDVAATSVPLPRDATAGTLTIAAAPRAPTATDPPGGPLAVAPAVSSIRLGPWPAAPLALALGAFPGYGPQAVEIIADGVTDAAPLTLELLPDPSDATPPPTTRLRFDAAHPQQTFAWFAVSPFRPGYRFRRVLDAGPPDGWSDLQAPGVALHVAAAAPERIPMQTVAGIDIYEERGIVAGWRYLPPAPIPARGPDGHPLINLFAVGPTAMLQMSMRFDLEDAQRDLLRAQLAPRSGTLGALQLQPVPLQVEGFSIQLSGGPGSPGVPLARSAGSGVPPWDAVFALSLDAVQATLARRALAGERGLLRATVALSFPPSVVAILGPAATLERSADIADWKAA